MTAIVHQNARQQPRIAPSHNAKNNLRLWLLLLHKHRTTARPYCTTSILFSYDNWSITDVSLWPLTCTSALQIAVSSCYTAINHNYNHKHLQRNVSTSSNYDKTKHISSWKPKTETVEAFCHLNVITTSTVRLGMQSIRYCILETQTMWHSKTTKLMLSLTMWSTPSIPES